jgi:hypothetical protein
MDLALVSLSLFALIINNTGVSAVRLIRIFRVPPSLHYV